MALKDDLELDMAIFFDPDDFGATGDYTSRDAGETVEVRLLADYGQVPGKDVGNTNATQATVHVPRSDLPSPARHGDLLEIDGVTWSVVKQAGGDKHIVTIELRRDARNRYNR